MNLADLFTVATLTKAINALPVPSTKLGDTKMFKVESTKHLHVAVDSINGRLVLVENTDRRDEPKSVDGKKRVRRVFEVPHLPKKDVLHPDDLQVAGFGESTEIEEQSKVINDKLQFLKDGIELTKEYHRVGAINGLILDADGTTVIHNLFDEFGVKEKTLSLDLDNPNADIRQNILNAKRHSEKQLGGSVIKQWLCYCSSEFFDKLTAHPNVQKAYANYAEASDKIGGDNRAGFTFGGVTFIEYSTQVVGSNGKEIRFIAENTGRLVPVATDLFKEIYAPANYNETAGTLGKEIYAKAEERRMGKGWDLEAQSNPLIICTAPSALVKFTV